MSNPWLRSNPFMGMWLGGANSTANSAHRRIAADARHQSTVAVTKATSDKVTIWIETIAGSPAPRRRRVL